MAEESNAIEELKIKVIPPNPETGLEDLHADLEYNLDNLNEGHITEYSIIFKSKTPEKLNIDSTIINNTITFYNKCTPISSILRSKTR